MGCTLNSNINPKCSQLYGGGIKSEIRLYKLSETKVIFDCLSITDIISNNNYLLYADGLEYKKEEDNGVFTHTLSGKILNISDSVQSSLFSAKNDSFLVVYRLKGSSQVNAFGVRFGAKLTYSQTINNEEGSFPITIQSKSNEPQYSVSNNALSDVGKVYAKQYKPSTYFCEVNNDIQTGFKVASYFVAVNANGDALDANGYKVGTTGAGLQECYALQGVSAGNYNVVSRYSKGDIVEGYPSKVYDDDLCENETSGTITTDKDTINLNTTTSKSAYLSVQCANNWSVLDAYKITTFKLSATSGNGGSSATTITLSDGTGGTEKIRLINAETREIKEVVVNSYAINTIASIQAENDNLYFQIPCVAVGGENPTVTATTTQSGVELEVVGNYINVTRQSVAQDTTFSIVVTHSNDATEQKTISVKLLAGGATSPRWVKVAQYCEVE